MIYVVCRNAEVFVFYLSYTGTKSGIDMNLNTLKGYVRVIVCAVLFLISPVLLSESVELSENVPPGVHIGDVDTNAIVGFFPKGESAVLVESIPDYYVVRLADGTIGKISKSLAVLKQSPPQGAITIASFNIQIFGKTKAGKPEVMAELADIIRKYDIVAIQEIKDISEAVPTAFLNEINKGGAQYAFILSERGGKQPSDQTSQEQYAYYFNTETIRVLDPGGLYVDSASDHFQREPYVARFGSVRGDLTFVLVTVHTKPTEAVSEIKALHDVIERAKLTYVGEDDFVALGDFNAGCSYSSPDDFDNHPIENNYTWIVPDDADTNYSTNTACAYDRIIISDGMVNDFTGDWGVGSVSSKQVSDHFPVWAKFSDIER